MLLREPGSLDFSEAMRTTDENEALQEYFKAHAQLLEREGQRVNSNYLFQPAFAALDSAGNILIYRPGRYRADYSIDLRGRMYEGRPPPAFERTTAFLERIR